MTNPHATEGTAALTLSGSATAPKLVTLAILKANWNAGRSYLDNFVPFVGECLRLAGAPVTTKKVQQAMRKRFGIRIPQHTLETVLKRARAQGLATKSKDLHHPNLDALAASASPSPNDFLRCHAAVVSGLRAFMSERYARTVDEADAGSALESYVAEYGTPIVVERTAATLEFDPSVVADPDLSYIVHAYVEHLAACDPAGFDYLATVVEGSMLASVVYLPEPGTVQRKFGGLTTVYLDTPFLLRVLGHVGPELKAPADELLQLLTDQRARVACFDNTLSELRGVILHAGQQLGSRSGRREADVVATFTKTGLRRADVELIAGNLESELRRRNIHVLASPPYTTATDIDEEELQAVLAKEVRYQRDQALRHDLDALTAIDRIRKGRLQPILEHCGAIFLTTNVNLVRAARRYFDGDAQPLNWPPAISDVDLATLIWLKAPLKAPDLPRKQIMADCYSKLRPTPAVWDRWVEEIARIESQGTYSDSDLDLIKFSPEAQRTLMDRTLGDAGAVDERTVQEVVEAARAAVVAPVAEQLQAAQLKLTAERERCRLAEERAAEREVALATVNAERDRRREVFSGRATRRAGLIGRLVFCVLLAVLVSGLGISMAGVAGVPGPSVPFVGRVVGALAVIATALLASPTAGGASMCAVLPMSSSNESNHASSATTSDALATCCDGSRYA